MVQQHVFPSVEEGPDEPPEKFKEHLLKWLGGAMCPIFSRLFADRIELAQNAPSA
jgi:hypothetical protein